ncbi:hypothetical protein [Okeania sp. SIO2C2]|nr:hypothetical protein [Okeania sp. SIO2C2]
MVKSLGVRSHSSAVRMRENHKDLVVMTIRDFFYVQLNRFDIKH